MAITLDGSNGITTDIASKESATFNRDTTDGELIILQKDNATVGSIGVDFGDNLTIDAGSGNSGLNFATSQLAPYRGGNHADNAIDLGVSSIRWKDLYLSGGVYLGGTGAANYLDDYEDGNWTPQVTIGGSNVTTSSTNNAYQIIGNYVFIEAVITFASGTNTGSIKITGLPTAVTGTSTFSKGIMTNDFFDNPERYYWYAYAGSQLELRVGGTTQSTGSRDLNGNDVKDNTNLQLYISGWYKTR